jgi:hypothetical protein
VSTPPLETRSGSRLTWAEVVAARLASAVASITIAFDPDHVLEDEDVGAELQQRGLDVQSYGDPMQVRYLYESSYRNSIDCGRRRKLVLALAASSSEASRLPFDVLSRASCASLSLGEFFPALSYPVVEALDPADLGALHEAVVAFHPRELNRQETIEFVVKHVYEVAPELIKRPADMLRVLARRHYSGLRVPAMFDQYIIDTVHARGLFLDWSLEELLSDRDLFFAFLQERWPAYLDRVALEKGLLDVEGADDDPEASAVANHPGLAIAGPLDIPFGHDDVHVYIDDLFYAGWLKPVEHPLAEKLGVDWLAAGLVGASPSATSHSLESLLDHVAMHVPPPDARHSDWGHFSNLWAELCVERWRPGVGTDSEIQQRIERVTAFVDQRFTEWVLERYGGLHNVVAESPVMVHQVPGVLSQVSAFAAGGRVALIVVDGMAMDLWLLLREALESRIPGLVFDSGSSYAWAPTLTSVSRQALLSGLAPRYFAPSIAVTSREEALWRTFWSGHGTPPDEVGMAKGLGDDKGWAGAYAVLDKPHMRVLAAIVNDVDDMCHGAVSGRQGLHAQVRSWAAQTGLADLLLQLMEQEFDVFLSADHGNVEARGIGSPKEKALADLRGERVRIYPNEILRDHVAGSFPSALRWDSAGLPDGFVPLIASVRDAFITEGTRTVTHGGVSLEELVVPWVHVRTKDAADAQG